MNILIQNDKVEVNGFSISQRGLITAWCKQNGFEFGGSDVVLSISTATPAKTAQALEALLKE